MKKSTIIALCIAGLLVLTGVGNYNGLVSKEQTVKASQSQIDNQLERRLSLIPNLISTTKGFASQEKEIFTSIAESRAKLAGANTMKDKANANAELSSSLSRLLVIAEQYPNLKSNETFKELMTSLEGTENRITVARKDYNTAVEKYNNSIVKFPSNIFAGMFGFKEHDYFKASEKASEVPTVDFTNN